jgi:hypothetical protein
MLEGFVISEDRTGPGDEVQSPGAQARLPLILLDAAQ